MTNNLEEQVQKLLAGKDEQNRQKQETGIPGNEATEEIQDIYVLIVREREEEEEHTQVIDSTPPTPPKHATGFEYLTLILVLICCLPIFASIAFQLYGMVNPPIATITILPKSQHVTLHTTLQLGRVLHPLTIRESQSVPTTGKGHQDAKQATGSVTFYNGQQTSQTEAAGTVFTGNDGVSIETTQRAIIPPGNPNTGYGTVTISAQALEAGSNGNIQPGDVNTPIALAVFVKNNQFTGGQNERDFQTVSKSDIYVASSPLKTAVTQSMSGALQGQLKPDEQVFRLPCHSTVVSDHQIGEEAAHIQVTVSQTCSAVAYNTQELIEKSSHLLFTTASQRLETGYKPSGDVQTTITSITVQKSVVELSVTVHGMFVYQITPLQAQFLTSLIAGKTRQHALALLKAQSGIESVSIAWGDDTKIPKDPAYIHFHIMVHA